MKGEIKHTFEREEGKRDKQEILKTVVVSQSTSQPKSISLLAMLSLL